MRQKVSIARTMIHERLIHFVASDAHTPDWRPPGLSAARAEIEQRWGATTAARLTSENPRLVIEDGSVPIDSLA